MLFKKHVWKSLTRHSWQQTISDQSTILRIQIIDEMKFQKFSRKTKISSSDSVNAHDPCHISDCREPVFLETLPKHEIVATYFLPQARLACSDFSSFFILSQFSYLWIMLIWENIFGHFSHPFLLKFRLRPSESFSARRKTISDISPTFSTFCKQFWHFVAMRTRNKYFHLYVP